MDAGVSTSLGDYKVTTVSIPTMAVRAGFYFNDRVSFEPSFGLTSVSGGGDHVTAYNATLGVLLHGRGSRVGAGVYVRPFAGLAGVNATGSSSQTQTNVGVGLGVAIPFAERMATRLELSYAHDYASRTQEGDNVIAAAMGLSFFSH